MFFIVQFFLSDIVSIDKDDDDLLTSISNVLLSSSYIINKLIYCLFSFRFISSVISCCMRSKLIRFSHLFWTLYLYLYFPYLCFFFSCCFVHQLIITLMQLVIFLEHFCFICLSITICSLYISLSFLRSISAFLN